MTNSNKARLHFVLSGDGSHLSTKGKYETRERDAVHVQKSRLAERAKIGKDWDGQAANDNIAWPLATALIKEGNTDLLKYAMIYRKVHDAAKSGAMLGGSSVSIGDGVSVDQRQWIKPNGDITYKGERKANTGAPEAATKRKSPTDGEAQLSSEKVESGYTNVPKVWKGDEPVNNMIDAQRKLSQMRASLGYLCEPFELACIDGATLESVGNAAGIGNRAGAMGAGRALVHTSLITIRDHLGRVSREDVEARL